MNNPSQPKEQTIKGTQAINRLVLVKFSYWTPFNDLSSDSHLNGKNSWMEQLVKPGVSFNQCFTQLGCWPVKWIYNDKIKALSLYSSRKGIFSNLHICVFTAGQIYCFGIVLVKNFVFNLSRNDTKENTQNKQQTHIFS